MDAKTRARAILEELETAQADVHPGPLRTLIEELKAEFEYGLACAVIDKTRDTLPAEQREWFLQQLALCTYKDDGLIPLERYQGALKILDEIRTAAVPAGSRESSETLALRGAVHKRIFEHAGQTEHLYRAARFYLEAWTSDPAADMGYGGVNAAHVMDTLGSLEKGALEAKREWATQSWAARAQALRLEMKQQLPGLAAKRDAERAGRKSVTESYWYRVTLAEIHWGLEEWEEAGRWLKLARACSPEPSEWELQTTVKQLVALARMRGVRVPAYRSAPEEWHPAWQALRELMGDNTRCVLSAHRGKVGLALSGGGFRASFFHLGVLARLAEMDVLRGVEVLSTVSGGSIVGAHYYLALRKLLQTKADEDIEPGEYVALIRQVQEQFLAAVQRNLRMRGLSSLLANARFVLPGSYTRSNRMGELYEEFIYSKVSDGHPVATPRQMRSLLIHPAVKAPDGTVRNDSGFKPSFSNWRRCARVPILLLNTTSLNTGHNWHFTARWMGEPPGLVGPESETLPRYRRLWYEEAPSDELRQYPLGYAVAASACVPALFEPLELRGLYPGRTVRLVDGGVHDNQGVAGLLDESCTLILCSDASGQMTDKPSPSNSILGVPLRSNSILMDRVRETEYLDLRARIENRSLQGLFFVHLKQELVADSITWIDGKTKPAAARSTQTSYKVDRELQGKLAAIRTDLDSFSEVEACSLMASGYLMTDAEFRRLDEHEQTTGSMTWDDYDVTALRGSWKFLELAPFLALPHHSSDLRRRDLGRQLGAASSRFLKAFKLVPWLQALGLLLLAAIAAGVAYFIYANWDKLLFQSSVSVGELLLAVLVVVAGILFPVARLMNPEGVMRSWALRLAIAVLGWIGTNLHLVLIDPIFLKRGKLERLLRLPER